MVDNENLKPYTYNLTDAMVIELYKKYGIKPLGVIIVKESDATYKIEACSLSDRSCNLF